MGKANFAREIFQGQYSDYCCKARQLGKRISASTQHPVGAKISTAKLQKLLWLAFFGVVGKERKMLKVAW